MSEYAAILKKIRFFMEVDDRVIQKICTYLKPAEYPTNARVFEQGDPGDALYIILSGRAKVVMQNDKGSVITLAVFGAGDIFGEMELLDGTNRRAAVVATEPLSTLVLPRRPFVKTLVAAPTAALRVLEEMCRRLRHADEIIGDLALLDVYGRVAKILIDLAKTEGDPSPQGVLLADPPSDRDLANRIGTSEENVRKVVEEFELRGLLTQSGSSYVLSHSFLFQKVGQS